MSLKNVKDLIINYI